MLALRLPKDIEDRLAVLAERTGRTKSYYAREAILTHLEDLEDYYLAAESYRAFKADGEQAVPVDEAVRRLGLED